MARSVAVLLLCLMIGQEAVCQATSRAQPRREGVGPTLTLPKLTVSNWEGWRVHILPIARGLLWERIPWLPSLAQGVRAARAQERPLLLWLMNGHPLGCT